MKKHLALSGLLALLTLHSAQAAQPNIRTQAQSPDSERRAERSGGIRGFFRGIVGEIQEGGMVIGDGFRDVRDGLTSRGSRDDGPPQNGGDNRFGYQNPPPPANNGGGVRMLRDPGPPTRGEIGNTRFGIRTDDHEMPTAAPRERTLPRQPAPAPVTRPSEPTRTREPLPEVRRETAPKPPVTTPSAPIRTESPVVKTVPEKSKPEIVAPKTTRTPPAPVEPAPTPQVADTPPTPKIESKPAPAPAPTPKTETPPTPTVEEKPVAKDEKGNPLPDKPDYPTATATKDPGIVLSPYAPHDMLDVKGMAPGSLAKDPATGQVFRVP